MAFVFALLGFLFWGDTPHPDYIGVCSRHVESKLSQYFKRNGFLVVGSGGSYLNCVRELNYYLVARKAVTEEEALQIYLSIYPGAKRILNESKELRFYLYEYPVSPNSLGVNIAFEDQNYKEFCFPYVSWMTNCGDVVFINYRDPSTGEHTVTKQIKCPELNAF